MAKKIPFFTTLPSEALRTVKRISREHRIAKWAIVTRGIVLLDANLAEIVAAESAAKRMKRYAESPNFSRLYNDSLKTGGPRRKARGRR